MVVVSEGLAGALWPRTAQRRWPPRPPGDIDTPIKTSSAGVRRQVRPLDGKNAPAITVLTRRSPPAT